MFLKSEKNKTILSVTLICLVGGIIYANSLYGPFQYDDYDYIIQKVGIRDVSDFSAIWHTLGNPTRVITFLSFALNYHFHGLNTFGYHMTNLIIHLINGVLVYWLTFLTFQTPRMKHEKTAQNKHFIALFCSLIFIAHPLQTQAVSYIVQRFASLATLFYLVSMCLYVKGRLSEKNSYGYFIGSLVSAVFGMFTKEIVFTLPLIVILYEVIFLTGGSFKKIFEDKTIRLFIVTLLGTLLIVPALFSFRVSNVLLRSMASGSHEGDVITSGNYLLTQFKVITLYVKLLFIPIGQNVLYHFPLSKSIFELPTLLSFVFLLLILGLGVKLYKRKVLIAFGIFWFFITLLVESSVIPIHHVIFEHRLYLPMVGFALVLCAALYDYVKNPKVVHIILGMIIVVCSVLTIERNKIWQDEILLWNDIALKSPGMSRPAANLGYIYTKRDQYDKALIYLNQAIELSGDKAYDYVNRGLVYQRLGKADMAFKDYDRAIEIQPNLAEAYGNKGLLYLEQGKFDEALKEFNQALKLKPAHANSYNNRGRVYFSQKKYSQALSDYNRAAELDSHFFDPIFNRGAVYLVQKKYDLALRDFNQAIEMNPQFSAAYLYRSYVYKAYRQYDKAVNDALKAKIKGFHVDQDYFNDLKKLSLAL